MNGRLYRGTWLLVGLPLLLLAFSVARPSALQAPNLPPAFDATTAASLAKDLALRYPDRTPGTPGAKGAAASAPGSVSGAASCRISMGALGSSTR